MANQGKDGRLWLLPLRCTEWRIHLSIMGPRSVRPRLVKNKVLDEDELASLLL